MESCAGGLRLAQILNLGSEDIHLVGDAGCLVPGLSGVGHS